jgi:hypothetical protein
MVPELRSLKPCRELAAMHGGTTALLVGTRLSPATARFYERSKSITMRAKIKEKGREKGFLSWPGACWGFGQLR